ncbi:hypothetical protein VZC37_24455 [Gordonia sp. LSe1-13]|uniref:Yip1 domain-containing protein n=1 Tax=Gordonia sesuvii TaxID=3116777 RepID=A0ABU7MKX6_9ACTN|nr:hypothetical protein [Gordonia sp. LSe1-13]
MNTNAEVDHLSDWEAGDFWLHLLGAALIPALVALGVALVAALVVGIADNLELPGWLELALGAVIAVATFIGVVWGLLWYGQSLYTVLRHATSWNRSFFWALVVVVVLMGVALYIADRLDVSNWRVVAAIGGVVGVPALIAWIVDALHRVAAWVPMAFGTFMGLVLIGILLVVAQALEPSRR